MAAGVAIGAVSGAVWAGSHPAVRAMGKSVGRAAGGSGNHWLVVTVNCPPEQRRTRCRPPWHGWPAGMRGPAARLRGGDPRRGLRDAKSLVETGEVIELDEPGSTHPTLTGRVFDLALRVAGGEGRL